MIVDYFENVGVTIEVRSTVDTIAWANEMAKDVHSVQVRFIHRDSEKVCRLIRTEPEQLAFDDLMVYREVLESPIYADNVHTCVIRAIKHWFGRKDASYTMFINDHLFDVPLKEVFDDIDDLELEFAFNFNAMETM